LIGWAVGLAGAAIASLLVHGAVEALRAPGLGRWPSGPYAARPASVDVDHAYSR
jgi:hypothetical protein